jgi:ABC-type glutathione transport system ATPase component
MTAVRRFCDRALLLEAGCVVEVGDPDSVGQRYLELNFSGEARTAAAEDRFDRKQPADGPAERTRAQGGSSDREQEEGRRGDRAAEVTEVWVEDARGERVEVLQNGVSYTVLMQVLFHQAASDPLFGVMISDDQRRPLLDMNNLESPASGRFEAGDVVAVGFTFPVVMAQGRHMITATVAHAGTGEHVMDRREGIHSVLVQVDIPTIGAASTPFEVSVVPQATEQVR